MTSNNLTEEHLERRIKCSRVSFASDNLKRHTPFKRQVMRFQLIHCRHIILITQCLHQLVDCAQTFCLHQYGTLACFSFFFNFIWAKFIGNHSRT